MNGCAALLSAVLASLLATHFGFTVVIALAMAFTGSPPGRSGAGRRRSRRSI